MSNKKENVRNNIEKHTHTHITCIEHIHQCMKNIRFTKLVRHKNVKRIKGEEIYVFRMGYIRLSHC